MNWKPGFTLKLIIISALSVGVIWLLFSLAMFYVFKDRMEEALVDKQLSAAQQTMGTVDRQLHFARQGIQALANDARLESHLREPEDDLESISLYLEQESLLSGPWHVSRFINREGRVVVSTDQRELDERVDPNSIRGKAFREALDGDIHQSDFQFADGVRNPGTVFSAPVRRGERRTGEIKGVVMGDFAWPVILQLLDDLNPSIKANLVNAEGTVIGTRTHERQRIGQPLEAWDRLDRTGRQNGPISRAERRLGDGPDIIVAAPQQGFLGQQGHNWTLILEVPRDELFAPVAEMGWQVGLITLAGLFALILGLYFPTEHLTRPIEQITQAVRSFSRGQRQSRAPAPSNDELGELGRSFNAMADEMDLYLREIEDNNREIRSFAYIVSHDLRAPLVNLKGFSSEIGYSLEELKQVLAPYRETLNATDRATLDQILEEDLPEALNFIGNSAQRMDHQIQGVLQLSRLGRREMTFVPVDSDAVVRRIIGTLEHQIAGKGIQIELHALPSVQADESALEQILGNLLDNAIKFMEPQEGSDPLIQVRAEKQAQFTVFHVEDNGPGISESNREKVFELFRRVGPATSEGDGMGLAYAQTLVRRHGGRIWCESSSLGGARFSFSLHQPETS